MSVGAAVDTGMQLFERGMSVQTPERVHVGTAEAPRVGAFRNGLTGAHGVIVEMRQRRSL